MISSKVLVVVDESPASERAVTYVAKIVGRQQSLRICLAHILPRLPPRLLEFRGAEHPQTERRLDAGLRHDQQRWMAGAKKKAQRALGMAAATLRRGGVPARALDVQVSEAVEGLGAADRVLELARTRQCDTVVVGRESVSWFRELVRSNLAEELVHRGRGFTIWVVE